VPMATIWSDQKEAIGKLNDYIAYYLRVSWNS
jgi:methenyltetrahydromethanopterin cyclohydrolase